jgi:hypothetical protein
MTYFQNRERLKLADGYYFPAFRPQSTLDTFVYHAASETADPSTPMFHQRKGALGEFLWLQQLGVKKFDFLVVGCAI